MSKSIGQENVDDQPKDEEPKETAPLTPEEEQEEDEKRAEEQKETELKKQGKKAANLSAEELKFFVGSQKWTTDEVIEYLKKEGIKTEVQERFRQEGIVGSDLPLLDKIDLIDMNLRVGDRLRMLRLLHTFKYNSMIANMSHVIWKGVEWHFCPCYPIFKENYTLTNTTLTLRKDRCFGSSQDRIDLSQITSVDFFSECVTSTVQLTSEDVTSPYVEIVLSVDDGKEAYKTINNAWEIDQQKIASARFQDVH